MLNVEFKMLKCIYRKYKVDITSKLLFLFINLISNTEIISRRCLLQFIDNIIIFLSLLISIIIIMMIKL